MEEQKEQYRIEYEEFLKNYSAGTTSGEGVGIVIARLAQYFTEVNLNYAKALIDFNNVAKDIECTVDEDSGKAISSAKAKVISSATVESANLINAKANLESIEQMINALKSLQRGLMNEYSHMGTM